MFLVCQFSLADLRGTLGYPATWRRPTWTNVDSDQFLRHFGQLVSRRMMIAQKINRRKNKKTVPGRINSNLYSSHDEYFIDAANRLNVPEQRLNTSLPNQRFVSRFSRVMRSAECVRLQIGIDARNGLYSIRTETDFLKFFLSIPQLSVKNKRVNTRHPKHLKKPHKYDVVDFPLSDLWQLFPKMYFESTTNAPYSRNKKLPPYISPLDPVVLLSINESCLPDWCDKYKIKVAGSEPSFEIALIACPFGPASKRLVNIILLALPPLTDITLARRIRGHLLRIPSDLQSFWTLLSRAQQVGHLNNIEPAAIEQIRQQLRRRSEGLGDRSNSLLDDLFSNIESVLKESLHQLTAERRSEISLFLDQATDSIFFRSRIQAVDGILKGATIGTVNIQQEQFSNVEKVFFARSADGRAVAAESYDESLAREPNSKHD